MDKTRINEFTEEVFENACRVQQTQEPDFQEFVQYAIHNKMLWNTSHKGQQHMCPWYPGSTILDIVDKRKHGPKQESKIMCIHDWAVYDDLEDYALSSWLKEMEAILSRTSITGWRNWYWTPFIKFSPTAFYTQNSIQKNWKEACIPFLDQELKEVNPEYILCFGTDAAKAFMNVSKLNLEDSLGQVYNVEHSFSDGSLQKYKVLVLPALKSIKGNRGVTRFVSLMRHQFSKLNICMNPEDPSVLRHRVVYSDWELQEEVDRVIELAKEDPKRRIIAVDMEWEGDYPDQTGAKLLTLQFSSKPGEATVVVLNEPDSGYAADTKPLVNELIRLLTWHDAWRPRVGGHFLRADLPWLMHLGICGKNGKDICWSYAPPAKLEYCKTDGGWDTSLMYHAYNEKESYGLKYLAAKELGTPRYEKDLQECIASYTKENHLKASDIHGFGCVPHEILHPYAAWDADVTRRLAELCMFGSDSMRPMMGSFWKHRSALLDEDAFGNDNWRPYWLAHRASLGFLDIENTGLTLDKERFGKLAALTDDACDILLQKLRSDINWPDFNPKSTPQKQGLLFGREYALSEKTSGASCVMPETANSFNLSPEYATKSRTAWSDVVQKGETSEYSPAADKTVLNLLSYKDPRVKLLRDVCKLKTALSSPLSKPVITWDQFGEHTLYPTGLYSAMREDGAIHSSMRVLLATGRASSSNPNLQNIGKSAEADFMRIFGYLDEEGEHGDYLDLLGGPRYLYPMRTVLRARPGYVLIESDFTGAELAVMAWISGDHAMIEHVRRNALSEEDPEYYDIHSHIAVQAFRLNCEPTKKGLASIHAKHLRVAAKAVVFG